MGPKQLQRRSAWLSLVLTHFGADIKIPVLALPLLLLAGVALGRIFLAGGVPRLVALKSFVGKDSEPLLDTSVDSKTKVETFYNEKYFAWQQRLHDFKARLVSPDFDGMVQPTDVVGEFGCSSGAVLNRIRAADKYCIELNPIARKYAAEHFGLKTFERTGAVPDNTFTFLYSTSVIEHVESPLLELKELYKKTKPGGRLFLELKNEGYDLGQKWWQNDKNNHLYTWNELNLHNLVKGAGFKTIKATTRFYSFPREFRGVLAKYGNKRFNEICEEYGRNTSSVYITVLARKPL